MYLIQLEIIDVTLLVFDLIFILLNIGYHFVSTSKEGSCNNVTFSSHQLVIWRYALYNMVVSVWIAALLTFTYPTAFRILFHLTFLTAISYNLYGSLPAWFCKKFHNAFHCNCDYYEYKDFELVLVVGTLLALLIAIFPDLGLPMLLAGLLFLGFIYMFIPKKEVEKLKYSENLVISTIDDLQNFIAVDPGHKKIISLLHSGCDLCSIQIAEINSLDESILRYVRVIDFTDDPDFDPFMLDFLNLSRDYKQISFPSVLLIEDGINFEKIDGIFSVDDLEIMINF